MLDRYLLRYFLAVVDHGSFSRAAAACNVSQPTLSIGVAKLERTLDKRLFVRSNQRVELTDAGVRFLGHARRIEREFNVAAEAMTPSADPPSLRLGVLGSVPGDRIATALGGSPPSQGRFELLFGTERELAGYLAKGRIDLALSLVGRGGDRFAERAIVTEAYRLALPASHAMAALDDIAPDALASEPMIVRRHCEALSETSRFFTERGIRPPFAFRSTNDERVLQMVAAGLGATVMPASYRHPGVARPRLAGFDLCRTLGWMVSHEKEHVLADPPPLMAAVEAALRAP